MLDNVKSPVEIEVLQEISEDDANNIATWMAEAFYRKDSGPAMTTGKTYEDDPEAHRLLFRAVIDRGSICGQALTTKDRNAFRVQFLPGQKNRILDLDWKSGKDDAWDKLVHRCGGADSLRKHIAPLLDICGSAENSIYGEEEECLKHVRSMFFGVKPGCQGQGIGRAMQNHTVQEAEKRNVTFFFWSNMTNLPLYEHLGCKAVLSNLDFGWPRLDGYPEKSELGALLEAVRKT